MTLVVCSGTLYCTGVISVWDLHRSGYAFDGNLGTSSWYGNQVNVEKCSSDESYLEELTFQTMRSMVILLVNPQQSMYY